MTSHMDNAILALRRFLHGQEPRVKELPLTWIESTPKTAIAKLNDTPWSLFVFAEEQRLSCMLHHQIFCPLMRVDDPESYEAAIRLLIDFCEVCKLPQERALEFDQQ